MMPLLLSAPLFDRYALYTSVFAVIFTIFWVGWKKKRLENQEKLGEELASNRAKAKGVKFVGEQTIEMEPEAEIGEAKTNSLAMNETDLFDRIEMDGDAQAFISLDLRRFRDAPLPQSERDRINGQFGGGRTRLTFQRPSAASKASSLQVAVNSFINKGSFGCVWKVRQLEPLSETLYALKIGLSDCTELDKAEKGTTLHSQQERQMREFKLAKEISEQIRTARAECLQAQDHGGNYKVEGGWFNLMETIRLGKDEKFPGYPVILMPLASSQDLFAYLRADRHKKFPTVANEDAPNAAKFMGLRERTIRHLFRQFASGLGFLHDVCDVIHRDLKCDQLLLQQDPTAYPRFNGGAALPAPSGERGEEILGMRLLISDFGEGKLLHNIAADGSVGTTNARTRMMQKDSRGNFTVPELGGFANSMFRAPEAVLSVKGEVYDGKAADVWAMAANILLVCVLNYPTICALRMESATIEEKARHENAFYIGRPTWPTYSRELQDLLAGLLEMVMVNNQRQHPDGTDLKQLCYDDIVASMQHRLKLTEALRHAWFVERTFEDGGLSTTTLREQRAEDCPFTHVLNHQVSPEDRAILEDQDAHDWYEIGDREALQKLLPLLSPSGRATLNEFLNRWQPPPEI